MIRNIASIIKLVSHSSQDCFVMKGKLRNIIDNQVIYLPPNLIKAPANSIEVIEGPVKGSYFETPNNEELVYLNRGWTLFERKRHLQKEGAGHHKSGRTENIQDNQKNVKTYEILSNYKKRSKPKEKN